MLELVGWGKVPSPPNTHWDTSLGNHRPPMVTVPTPCLWTPFLGRWLLGRGELPSGFLWPGGEGQMPAPLALPILLASKFLSNTFWGFSQPPPQILAGRSGFPFPKEAGSFQGPAWEGQDEVGDSLLTPDVCCSSTAPLQTPSLLCPGSGWERTGVLGLCLWEDFPGSSRTWGWPGLEKLVTWPTWVSGPLPTFCPRGLRGSHPTNVCKCFEIFLQCV